MAISGKHFLYGTCVPIPYDRKKMDAPSSSLIELSRLAFSTPLLWLSPETGDENQVGWISISLDETCQGDVFLLPSKEIDSELLAAAQQKGVDVILLLGDFLQQHQAHHAIIAKLVDQLKRIHKILARIFHSLQVGLGVAFGRQVELVGLLGQLAQSGQ